MPQVIIEQPHIPPMTVPLTGVETYFGRAEDNDVVLVADEVSRHHAKIVLKNELCLLVDLKSLNGTYVNRQRIVERMLTHMDEIWFGSKCRVVFRDDTRIGKESATPQAKNRPDSSDSEVQRNMDLIREEMDRVGNNMTMIGTRAEISPEGRKTPIPEADEVVKMGRAYRRLSALYQTSQLMASEFDLDERLAKVLDTVMEVMNAERGFVMLKDASTDNLNVKVAREMGQELQASSPSMGIAGKAAIDGEPVLMSGHDKNEEFSTRESIIINRIVSAMCVPLRVEDRLFGSIYLDTRDPKVSFNEEDLELFASLASQSAMAIDNVRLHERVLEEEKKRLDLGRFLSPAIVEKVIKEGANLELGGQKALVTTMFCDIRSSSKLAERVTPQELVSLLNEHFTAMTELVFRFNGTLDKYIGDELMAVFGAPIASDRAPYDAVAAALAIQAKNEELNQQRESENRPQLQLGIGINSGEVIAGYLGSPQRMEFTVVGDRVNTAKRFCDMASPGNVVIGHGTYEHVGDRIHARPIGTVSLKGKEIPERAYEVVSLK